MSSTPSTARHRSSLAGHRSSSNPYRSPQHSRSLPRLHSARGIALATFFGGPVAAGVTYAMNFTRRDGTGDRPRAATAVAGGMAGTALLVGLFSVLPLPTGVSTIVFLGLAMLAKKHSEKVFAAEYERLERMQQKTLSAWYGAIIGLTLSFTLLGLMLLFLL